MNQQNKFLLPDKSFWMALDREQRKVLSSNARDKRENINIELFRKDYEDVADFEQKHNVKLPEGIAAMLTHPPQA